MSAGQRVWSRIGATLLVWALVFLYLANGLSAVERLQNGGFEQGNTGWTQVQGFSTSSGCDARSGSNAGALILSPSEQVAQIRQLIDAPATGAYELAVYARSLSGAATLRLQFLWRDEGGAQIQSDQQDFTPNASYQRFELSRAASPANARSLLIHISAPGTGAATICLDDASLNAPAAATPTATATATATATSTATNTATTTSTATRTATATATGTQSPTATATSTSTAEPTSTPTPSTTTGGAGMRFVNGGFEDETDGWQKFGGELQAVDAPRRAGSSAALLSSSTESTKWAFQLVRVDEDESYAFAGYVQAVSGVETAYLRISWYESADGSGTAIATYDSTATVSGSTAGFVHLTTGPRTPPAGARSARLRVMLAPVSAAPAFLYLDDFSFGPATALPTLTPTPPALAGQTAVGPPTQTPVAAVLSANATATPTAAIRTAVTATVRPSVVATRTPTRVAEVAAAVQATRPRATPEAPPSLNQPASAPSGILEGVPLSELGAGLLLALVGFRVALFVARRHRA